MLNYVVKLIEFQFLFNILSFYSDVDCRDTPIEAGEKFLTSNIKYNFKKFWYKCVCVRKNVMVCECMRVHCMCV